MRGVGFIVLFLGLILVAAPASANDVCKKMAEEPPKDRPAVALLHWPEIIIHPHISIEVDATQPDGTGTATLYGPVAHANEVENFYAALFRDRGWRLAPEYQLSHQYVFLKKNRRMVMSSGVDRCMGYSLTLHATAFDPEKYKPEKPFVVELHEHAKDAEPKSPKKEDEKKRNLSPEAQKLPHNIKKNAEAAKEGTDATSGKATPPDAKKTETNDSGKKE